MNRNSSRAVPLPKTLELVTPLLHININVFISIIHHPYAQRNILCWEGGNIMFQLRISLLLRHLIALLYFLLYPAFFPPLDGKTTTNVRSLRITTAWERARRVKFILHSHARIFTITRVGCEILSVYSTIYIRLNMSLYYLRFMVIKLWLFVHTSFLTCKLGHSAVLFFEIKYNK